MIRNQPLLDGNKRIGFTAAITFLESNGCLFGASEAEATEKTLALAARAMDNDAYAAWLRENFKKV